MDKGKMVRLSKAELEELKALLDAEIERRLSGIKERMMADYFIASQYDKPEVWDGIKGLIVELVQSPLVGIRQGLDVMAVALPEEPGEEPEEPVEVPGEKPEEPVEKVELAKVKARFGEREL